MQCILITLSLSLSLLQKVLLSNVGRKVFIETYGCQMNVSDTEIVNSIMQGAGLSLNY